MGYRTTYEVYINGTLVCRGKADYCAECLGVKPNTLRHYPHQGHSPSYLKVVPFQALYDICEPNGTVLFVGTVDECAERLGKAKNSITASVSTGMRLGGYVIKRHQHEECKLPQRKIDELLEAAKEASYSKEAS